MAFESDSLPLLRSLVETFPQLGEFLRVLPSSVCVIDTCYFLRTVRARTQLRTPGGRTAFEEAVDSGSVLAVAPPELLVEFDANLDEFAKESRSDPDALRREMPEVRRRIAIIEPPPCESADIEALRRVDPKDVPFARVYEHVRADWMLSDDHHWDVTSYRVHKDREGLATIKAVKNYARDAALVHGSQAVVGGTVVGAGIIAVETFKVFRKAPALLQMVLAGAGVLALLHHGTRQAIASGAGKLFEKVRPEINGWIDRFQAAEGRMEVVEGDVVRRLPTAPDLPRPLLQASLRALAAEGRPLAEDELLRLVQRHGYRRAKPNPGYLRRLLRAHPGLAETEPRKWALKHRIEAPREPSTGALAVQR